LADIVIYGHTHRAAEDWIEGALYLNPGSAGAPRDGNAASIAILTIENDSISVAWPRLSRSD
jgi:putative phosphoesterase